MDNIVIHLPKTGGTTLIANLLNIDWQPERSFYYRHVSHQMKDCNARDIFFKENFEKYKNFNLIMFIRDPFERAFSEYHYLKDKDEFMNLFEKIPENFKEFIENSQNKNPMINFMIGHRLYTRLSDSECLENLNCIMEAINNLNFVIGETENYNLSLNNFVDKTGIIIPEKIINKRMAIQKRKIDEWKYLEDYFKEKNKMDYILYYTLKEIFNSQVGMIKNIKNYEFVGNKYDYVQIYITRHNILEAYDVPRNFIKLNLNSLMDIHRTVLKGKEESNTENGKQYLIDWLKLFSRRFKIDIEIDYNDPIKSMEAFARMKHNLFIHIPKTGGSTFVTLLQRSFAKESYNPNNDISHLIKCVSNTEIRHLNFDSENRISECRELFVEKKHDSYMEYNIFTLIRHPVDRLISEFIFQYHVLGSGETAAIINRLSPKPTTFFEYIKFPEVHNYQLKFLLGTGVADKYMPVDKDLEYIINCFDTYNVNVFTTDNYNKFVEKYQQITKQKLNSNFDQVKKSPSDIKEKIINSLTPEIENFILKMSNYDHKLYLYAKSKSQ